MALHIVKRKGGKGAKGAKKKAYKPKRLEGDVKEGKAKCFPVAKREFHPKLQRVLHLLMMGGLPFAIMATLEHVAGSMTSPNAEVNAVEFFAGCKSICRGFRSLGFSAASFEITDRPQYEDFLSGIGFAYGLALVMRLFQTAGLAWLAPVCSSWVWINRYTAGRSRSDPLGFRWRGHVAAANEMVSRCCIIMMMCCILKIPFISEQPASSLLQFHPDFQYMCKRFQIFRVFIWIGSYGGGSPKPTFLYSNYRWVECLYLPLPCKQWDAEMSLKYTDQAGTKRVCGGTDLKSSQYYPTLLGRAVAELYKQNRADVQAQVSEQEQKLDALSQPMKSLRETGWASSCHLMQVIRAVRK